MEIALSNGDVIIMAVAVASVVAAVTYVAGSGRAYEEIGKSIFVMDSDVTDGDRQAPAREVSRAERDAEIRQMVEAKAYRNREAGKPEVDVEAELERLLRPAATPPALESDPALIDEVRQMVIARNARLEAKGKPPLDVESELARRLAELEGLGQ